MKSLSQPCALKTALLSVVFAFIHLPNVVAAQGSPIKEWANWSIDGDRGKDKNSRTDRQTFADHHEKLIYDAGYAQHGQDLDAPSQPGKPLAAVTAFRVALRWSASQGKLEVDHYEVWRDNAKRADALSPEWTDTLVEPGKNYSYFVIALDKAGRRSIQSEALRVTTETEHGNDVNPDVAAPSVPQGLESIHIGQTTTTIAWRPSSVNIGMALYHIWRGGQKVGSVNTTKWTDNALTAATTYHYQVSAQDAAGNQSAKSQSIAVTTEANTPGDGTTWSRTRTYIGGDIVNWNGQTYKARDWTQGSTPGESDVWERQKASSAMAPLE